jgi:hypothetical protein
MYQLSPLQMITRQQAIILETFTSALNGALEAPERDSKKLLHAQLRASCAEHLTRSAVGMMQISVTRYSSDYALSAKRRSVP